MHTDASWIFYLLAAGVIACYISAGTIGICQARGFSGFGCALFADALVLVFILPDSGSSVNDQTKMVHIILSVVFGLLSWLIYRGLTARMDKI